MEDLETLRPGWLEGVQALDAMGRHQEAVCRLMSGMDDLFCAGKFAEADALALRLDLSVASTHLAFCAVVTLWSASDQCQSFPEVLRRGRKRVAEVAGREYSDRLFRGIVPGTGGTP